MFFSGKGLLTTFGNLGKALKVAYPEFNWYHHSFSFRGKKSEQRRLVVNLQAILPKDGISGTGSEIFEHFWHPGLPGGI
jgi:hypothetical protein